MVTFKNQKMMDIRQSDNYAKYVKSIGWLVERVNTANIFIKKLGPFSLIKIQRPQVLDLEKIKETTKKHRPLLIKIEPEAGNDYSLLNTEYSLDSWPLLPTKTIILDLETLSLKNLPKDTRYEIRKSQKAKLILKESADIDQFYKLLQETMKIGNWSIPIRKEVVNLYQSFQPDSTKLLFIYDGQKQNPVAACLLIWEGGFAHYMYAACNQEGRRLGAPYFLLWETIKFLQNKKIKHLDLEGIYDERYKKLTKKWQGFTKFKLEWNGRVVSYPGSYIHYLNPLVKLFSYLD
jgi:lipid II:glycine glycyltransferase (peptidoglycan interpeptide bridge formation enzyme)